MCCSNYIFEDLGFIKKSSIDCSKETYEFYSDSNYSYSIDFKRSEAIVHEKKSSRDFVIKPNENSTRLTYSDYLENKIKKDYSDILNKRENIYPSDIKRFKLNQKEYSSLTKEEISYVVLYYRFKTLGKKNPLLLFIYSVWDAFIRPILENKIDTFKLSIAYIIPPEHGFRDMSLLTTQTPYKNISVIFKCNNCKRYFLIKEKIDSYIKYGGSSCRACSYIEEKKVSIGEGIVNKILRFDFIPLVSVFNLEVTRLTLQETFPEELGRKSFDFYLDLKETNSTGINHKIIIEFDGEYHLDSISQIESDLIKTRYCKENNIKLFRIADKSLIEKRKGLVSKSNYKASLIKEIDEYSISLSKENITKNYKESTIRQSGPLEYISENTLETDLLMEVLNIIENETT